MESLSRVRLLATPWTAAYQLYLNTIFKNKERNKYGPFCFPVSFLHEAESITKVRGSVLRLSVAPRLAQSWARGRHSVNTSVTDVSHLSPQRGDQSPKLTRHRGRPEPSTLPSPGPHPSLRSTPGHRFIKQARKRDRRTEIPCLPILPSGCDFGCESLNALCTSGTELSSLSGLIQCLQLPGTVSL